MKEISTLKSQFLLNPEIVFLNHGSFGATPLLVFQAYQQWQRQLEEQPVKFLGREYHALLFEARQSIAKYLDTKADNLVFVPNATTGINIAARSLSLQKGDIVLSTDHEYGAMDRTWRYQSRQKEFLYENITVPQPFNRDLFLDELFSKVTKQTRVIFLSHITSPTSIVFPIKEVCLRAREMGIITVIDGAHAPGQIPLNLEDLGADIYTGNFHKWLCAPKGSAFLYVRPEMQSKIEPFIVSWGYESETPGISTFQDYLEWTGTRDISAYLSVPAAIQFQENNEWKKIRRECHDLAARSLHYLTSKFNLTSLYSTDDCFAQMVTIPVPGCIPADELKSLLYDHYNIEIPVISWGGRMFVRLSVQAYNTEEEIERFHNAVSEIYNLD